MTEKTRLQVVRFGKRERFPFENIGSLETWAPQMVPAVYALTYRRDPESRPKAHTVIYFGFCNDMSKEPRHISHDVCDWWVKNGGKLEDIHVFIHAMPGSTERERAQVQSQLISEYGPAGNY